MYGRSVIEADDSDEAEQILHDGLSSFDTGMFDQFDVDSTETVDVEPADESDE
jgi:hypothetical protein